MSTSSTSYAPKSMSQFIHSIKNGDMKQLIEEFEVKEVDVNQQINDRYPLHYAADYGQAEVMKFLLSHGANVNVEDSYGVTPILAAIWEGRTKCVQVLLEHGAERSGLTPDGKTYMEAADEPEIKKLLAAEESICSIQSEESFIRNESPNYQ